MYTTEYTEWQQPLFGIYSIMMEKLAQAGKVGGACPIPFNLSKITYKVWSTLQLRGQIHSPFFYSNLCVLCGVHCTAYRGRILGRNPDKSLKSFPPPLQDLYYFKLTQPLTYLYSKVPVHCKGQRRKT